VKRIFPFILALLFIFSFFAPQVEGARAYTHWELISTDTLTDQAACTLYTQTHRVFPDSSYWQMGFSTNQANDSVDLKIDAYWGVDSTSGPWTDAQAVAANHTVDDYIMTPYASEFISKWFEWEKIIILGNAGNGVSTIVKTYIGYRKYWLKEK